MQEEHAAWVRNNEDGLRSAFAALQTEDAAHSHLFGAMTFEHFCVFANNERDSGEKRAAASGSTALPMEGMASHRTTESFEEMVGEERYFIGECTKREGCVMSSGSGKFHEYWYMVFTTESIAQNGPISGCDMRSSHPSRPLLDPQLVFARHVSNLSSENESAVQQGPERA